MIITGFVPGGRLEADLIVSELKTKIVRVYRVWSDNTGFTLLRVMHQSEVYSIKL